MNQLRTSACVLAALLMTGCAAASGQAPVTGHLAGRLVMEGGPMGLGGQQPGERPMPGTVTFAAAGHRQVAVQVGASGTFSVQLPAGTYQVSGRSPDIETSNGSGASETDQELPCSQPLSAKITAGHVATVTVTCVVP
jgi:hypothetical protein